MAEEYEGTFKLREVINAKKADDANKVKQVETTKEPVKAETTPEVKKAEPVTSKFRKAIRDLGPLGMIGIIGAIFIFNFLLGDDLGGGLLGSSSSSGQGVLEERQKEKITALFDSIEEVTVDNIIISYETITDSSTTLFASSQSSQLAAKSVVILHQGAIIAEYDITRAISLLLDVPFHQISLLNTTDIIGGN